MHIVDQFGVIQTDMLFRVSVIAKLRRITLMVSAATSNLYGKMYHMALSFHLHHSLEKTSLISLCVCAPETLVPLHIMAL